MSEDSRPPVTVALKDANILIDLVNASILGSWFALGYRTITTNMVIQEVSKGDQWEMVKQFIASGQLEVIDLNSSQVALIYTSYSEVRVSVADKSVLVVAEELGATLLTGDMKVRREGYNRNLDVRGILWIYDELINKSVITYPEAVGSLESMLKQGSWLPDNEVAQRLSYWKLM